MTAAITAGGDDSFSTAVGLDLLSPSQLPTIRRTGQAGGSDLQDYYSFTLDATSDLRLNLSGMQANLDIELLDSFGVIIASAAQIDNAIERVSAVARPAGQYFVRVYSRDGGGTNYTLEITTFINGDDVIRSAPLLGVLTSFPLATADSVGGQLDIQDYYRFTITAQRNVTVLLTGLSADLDLDILDSFGRVIFTSALGGTSIETASLVALAPGDYFIRVYPFGGALSSYTLTVI